LPGIVKRLSAQWNLHNLTPLPQGWAGNMVYAAEQKLPGGLLREVVLKVGYDHQAIKQEAYALRFFSEGSCVVLLDNNEECAALLLERIAPGTRLLSCFLHDEKQAIHITVQIVQNLHSATGDYSSFPTIQQWLTGLEKNWPYLQNHLPKARALASYLVKTQQEPVLLHGDLHHENILQDHAGTWLAIDPKGVIGEPAYEVGSFVRNPIPDLLEQPNILGIISYRLDLFAELLKIDRQRIKEWCYVQEVLADCWSLKDGADPENMFDLARIIADA